MTTLDATTALHRDRPAGRNHRPTPSAHLDRAGSSIDAISARRCLPGRTGCPVVLASVDRDAEQAAPATVAGGREFPAEWSALVPRSSSQPDDIVLRRTTWRRLRRHRPRHSGLVDARRHAGRRRRSRHELRGRVDGALRLRSGPQCRARDRRDDRSAGRVARGQRGAGLPGARRDGHDGGGAGSARGALTARSAIRHHSGIRRHRRSRLVGLPHGDGHPSGRVRRHHP